ncbi:arsinothricin resistance N-acetyltransferase ArsN1 family A [Patulibacter sp. S7RM1-6]
MSASDHLVAVRDARLGDEAVIANIYNEGIRERLATFETQERSADDVRAWFDDLLPLLVAERRGRIVGWARISPYSSRPAYSGVGEHAVYVARAGRRAGVGLRLLDALATAAQDAGLHKLTSRIFTDNTASVELHAAAGFDVVGVHRHHAKLDGQWKDCVVVERLLD